MDRVRTFLIVEAAAFAVASLIHADIVVGGYAHRQASIAESVIAAVLIFGLMVSLGRPYLTRGAGLAAQGFALLGTCVGITMIAIGVGPRSVFDVLLHAGFVTMLVAGLVVTARRPLAA